MDRSKASSLMDMSTKTFFAFHRKLTTISFCRSRCTAQDVYACISNMTSSSGNLFCRSFPTLAGQSRQADWCFFRCELYDYKASKVVVAQRSLEAFQTPTQTHPPQCHAQFYHPPSARYLALALPGPHSLRSLPPCRTRHRASPHRFAILHTGRRPSLLRRDNGVRRFDAEDIEREIRRRGLTPLNRAQRFPPPLRHPPLKLRRTRGQARMGRR